MRACARAKVCVSVCTYVCVSTICVSTGCVCACVCQQCSACVCEQALRVRLCVSTVCVCMCVCTGSTCVCVCVCVCVNSKLSKYCPPTGARSAGEHGSLPYDPNIPQSAHPGHRWPPAASASSAEQGGGSSPPRPVSLTGVRHLLLRSSSQPARRGQDHGSTVPAPSQQSPECPHLLPSRHTLTSTSTCSSPERETSLRDGQPSKPTSGAQTREQMARKLCFCPDPSRGSLTVRSQEADWAAGHRGLPQGSAHRTLSPARPSGEGPGKGHVVGDAASAVTHILPNMNAVGQAGWEVTQRQGAGPRPQGESLRRIRLSRHRVWGSPRRDARRRVTAAQAARIQVEKQRRPHETRWPPRWARPGVLGKGHRPRCPSAPAYASGGWV